MRFAIQILATLILVSLTISCGKSDSSGKRHRPRRAQAPFVLSVVIQHYWYAKTFRPTTQASLGSCDGSEKNSICISWSDFRCLHLCHFGWRYYFLFHCQPNPHDGRPVAHWSDRTIRYYAAGLDDETRHRRIALRFQGPWSN